MFKFPRDDERDDLPSGVLFTPLHDGQKFEVDGATLDVLHTPGHTTDSVILHLKVNLILFIIPGFQTLSICLFYSQEENAVFSADTMLGEGTTVFEDLHDYMLSLKKILELQPSVIYPGHGPVIKVRKIKRNRTNWQSRMVFVFLLGSD